MNIKSFGKSTFIYSIGTIALRFTTFLLIPLYTHYLTKAEFGLLQTLLLSVQVIITINDLGMRSALMRFFAEYEKKNKLNVLLGSSFSLNIIIGLFFILLALSIPNRLISTMFNIETIPNLILFTVLVAIGQTLSLNILSYFRAKDQGIVYMIVSLLTSLFLIALTYLLLVIFKKGIVGILWAQAISFFLMWFLILLWILLKHGLTIKKETLITLFKFGSPLIFAMSGDLIINTSGNYFLGYFNSLEDVAIFSLAYKIASIGIMVLIGPFQMAYEPFVFRNKDDKNLNSLISRILLYIIIVFIVLGWGLVFIFKDLISLIAPSEYKSAFYFIFLILPGVGITLFNYIGQSLLHINNKTKTTGTIVLASTIISLVASYFLIKSYGIYGLVVGLNFYLFLSSIALFYFGNKEVKIKLDFPKLSLILFIGIILFISVYILSYYNDYVYYTLSPLVFVMGILVLWKSNIFSQEEKNYFKNILRK